MVTTLVKTAAVAFEGQNFPVHYFEVMTKRGIRRYSAEILVGPDDRIILDDDSVLRLEAKATRVAPVVFYSRMLARLAAA